jgi:hypothetical protein
MWLTVEARVGDRTRVNEGAAATAPTAPHATVSENGDDARTGPARFWSARRVHQGLAVGFVVSAAFHYVISPFSVLPDGPPIEIHDQAGDLSIPIDLVSENAGDPNGSKSHDPKQQGGTAVGEGLDGSASEAGLAAHGADGGTGDASDDADIDQNDDAGGMVAIADGGVGRDPQSMLGAAASVSAGPNNITIMVNFTELRKHPDGARLGIILGGIPQWKAFMSNAQGAPLLDPMRDADWMIIMGPSLIDTKNDAVFVHYSASDAQVDQVIETVSRHSAHGGPVDLGVHGVKAWKAFADNGERVFMRPRSHIAVIVPSSKATDFARVLVHNPPMPHVRAGEALSVRALRPGGSIPAMPQDISEMRLWIVPRPSDGGADLYIEGDCPSDAAAQIDAEAVKTLIQQKNSFAVRLITAGFFSHVDVTTVGPQVHAHIDATQEQIEALMALVAGRVGVTLPPPSPHTPSNGP